MTPRWWEVAIDTLPIAKRRCKRKDPNSEAEEEDEDEDEDEDEEEEVETIPNSLSECDNEKKIDITEIAEEILPLPIVAEETRAEW